MAQTSSQPAAAWQRLGVSRLAPELIEALPRVAHRTPVEKAMERASFLVGPDMTLIELMRLFVDMDAHAAPVVDERGEPIGVVSKAETLLELSDRPQAVRGSGVYRTGGLRWENAAALCVRDIMTPLSTVVSEDTSLADAAAVIAHRRVHPLPVMDTQGQVAGILSSIDVLRWLAQNDGQLKF